jgi:hypothetical protein
MMGYAFFLGGNERADPAVGANAASRMSPVWGACGLLWMDAWRSVLTSLVDVLKRPASCWALPTQHAGIRRAEGRMVGCTDCAPWPPWTGSSGAVKRHSPIMAQNQ